MGGVMTPMIQAIQPSLLRKQKYSLPPAITSPVYRYMYYRVKGRWQTRIRVLVYLTLMVFHRHHVDVPQIEVTFDIDANGILHVTAKDKGTGKEQKIRIEAGSGLSKEEIEKMKDEAKAHEAKDKAAREKVDKLNQADSLIFQTEKQLKEYGDKIPADKKAPIEAALNKLKEAHKTRI